MIKFKDFSTFMISTESAVKEMNQWIENNSASIKSIINVETAYDKNTPYEKSVIRLWYNEV